MNKYLYRMEIIAPVAGLLPPGCIDVLRSNSPLAEQNGRLTAAQLQLAYAHRWFSLLAPTASGGAELPLPEAVRLEEALAYADGSTGWVVTLCAGASWFGGFLAPALAALIFADPLVCLAGSGAPGGRAEITGEGYLVNGQWAHASGAPHATWFTANCRLTRKGVPLTNQQGLPLIRSFIFSREEVTLLPSWQSFGLVATASHSYKVEHLQVPAERGFQIDLAQAAGTLYHYPFLQLAEATLAANSSGMCLHFLEEAQELLQQKPSRSILAGQQLVAAQQDVVRKRTAFYDALDHSWQQQLKANSPGTEQLHMLSTAARQLARCAREAVAALYPYCGLYAAGKNTCINQVWRDIHTASQHSLLVYPPIAG